MSLTGHVGSLRGTPDHVALAAELPPHLRGLMNTLYGYG